MKKKWLLLMIGMAVMTVATACKPTVLGPDGLPYKPLKSSTETSADTDEGLEALEDMDALDEMLFVYRSNADGTELERVTSLADEFTEQGLLEKLIEYGVLEEGTEILSFEIEGNIKAGPGMTAEEMEAAGTEDRIGYLNLSKVPTLDAAAERVMLNCIAATFIDNYQLDQVKLLVNGENYKSENITQGDKDYLMFDMHYKDIGTEKNTEKLPETAAE